MVLGNEQRAWTYEECVIECAKLQAKLEKLKAKLEETKELVRVVVKALIDVNKARQRLQAEVINQVANNLKSIDRLHGLQVRIISKDQEIERLLKWQ